MNFGWDERDGPGKKTEEAAGGWRCWWPNDQLTWMQPTKKTEPNSTQPPAGCSFSVCYHRDDWTNFPAARTHSRCHYVSHQPLGYANFTWFLLCKFSLINGVGNEFSWGCITQQTECERQNVANLIGHLCVIRSGPYLPLTIEIQ